MRIGYFLGIPVLVNPFFLLLVLFCSITGLLVQVGLLFAIVLWHELAHVLVAKSHGLQVAEIELLPFGGVARIDELLQLNPPVEAWVAVAGPLSNLVLVGLGFFVQSYFPQPDYWFLFFIQANLAMVAINLLPALPLDGGRILRSYLVGRFGYRKATERAVFGAIVIACALLSLGFVGVYFYGSMGASSLIVIAFFLYIVAQKEKKSAAYVFMRYLTRKKLELRLQRVMVAKELVATVETSLGEVLHQFTPPHYHIIWVVNLDGEIIGIVTEMELINGLLETGIHGKLSELTKYRF